MGVYDIWLLAYLSIFFRSNEQMLLVKTYLAMFAILIPCWLIFQFMPIPAHALRVLSPELFADIKWIKTQASWIFEPHHGWTYISYFPQKSMHLCLHGIACLLLFFLLVHLIKTRFQLNVTLYGFFFSLILGTLSGCLFFYDWSEKTKFSFVNHHMALIMNVLIPMSLGLLLSNYRKTKKPVFKTFFYSLKITLKNLIQGDQAKLMKTALFFIVLFGFILIARPFGLKLLGLSITLLFGGLLLASKPKMRSHVIVWGGTGLILGIYALISQSIDSSLSIDTLLIQVLKDYPLVGVGPGALPVVSTKYTTTHLTWQSFQTSHCSAWLKIVAESGLLGTGLFLAAIVIFLARMNLMWHKRQSSYNVGWGIGIMMALVGVGLCGMGYGFGNPYIIMPMIAILAACGFLVLHAGHHSSRQAFFYRTISINRKSLHSSAITGGILLMLLTGMIALMISNQYDRPTKDQLNGLTESERIYILKKNIFNASLWHQMAIWYQEKKDNAIDHMNKDLPRADICFEIACYLAPNNHRIMLDAAAYWVFRSKTLNDDVSFRKGNGNIPETQQQGIILFQKKYKTVLKQKPDKIQSVVDAIWQWYSDDTIVLDAIPEKPKYMKQAALKYVLLQKNK
ncbi:MAG: hypothetical protein OMM_01106 [Candidatus Magnetoglobus multicellularis str. Araruama]|uniref:O-antigen polymerase n=1 Tax=Candidatus Magnetoglobus multicellularis str. Araruama TaxID=890399 RepID=A0A1V1PEP8_9BACT|nr:MAG: hypothetical protein OMM_01106 [Candidatus Magnetoglobus multicellularis str. Araruama]